MDIATLALAYSRAGFPADLTIRQLALLGILCDEPVLHETKALAERLCVSKPIITRAMNHFLLLGMVRRVPVEDDRRRCTIEPTDAGRQFRARLAALSTSSFAKAA